MLTDKELDEALEMAREAALEAWRAIEPFFQGSFEVFEKEGEGPATEADIAADHAIVDFLRSRYPAERFSFLTEETCKEEARLETPFCWIIDPIDGTRDFMKGEDDFAVHIALAGRPAVGAPGEPLLGVVYEPRAALMHTARRGGGARIENLENGTTFPLHVSGELNIDDAVVVITNTGIGKRLASVLDMLGARKVYSRGSLGLKAMEVAAGRADLYINTGRAMAKEWDVCAPHAILAEAGGTATTLRGKPVAYMQGDYYLRDGLLMSNGHLHEELIRMLDGVAELWR